MNIRKVIILSVLGFNILFAQSVKVIETINISRNLNGKNFYPKFSSDDSKILFSKSNYKGLYNLDLSTNEITTISEKNGAGYNPLLHKENDEIFYKTFKIENGRKLTSVNSYSLKTKTTEILIQDKRRVSIPNQLISNELLILENSNVKNYPAREQSLAKNTNVQKTVYVENNNLILVNGNAKKILNPLGDGVYVWETLSKDGQKIIFSFANKGAFICNLEGEILHRIPNAHYPRLSPNGRFLLYMVDEDDGSKYTASELFVYSLDEEQSYKLTNTNNKIEMYAEWSNSGNSFVYNTIDGEIFLAQLEIEN